MKRIPFWGVELVNILANCRTNVQRLKIAHWHAGNYHLLPVFVDGENCRAQSEILIKFNGLEDKKHREKTPPRGLT